MMGGQGASFSCVLGFGVMQVLVISASMGLHEISEVF